jgi:hypothetical protein
MSDPSLIPPPLHAASIQRAERHLQLLEELAEIGMDLARALKRRVEAEAETSADKEQPPPAPTRDPADAFQRLSRAVRLTLALEARMAEALRALIAGEVAAAETRRAQAGAAQAKRRAATERKVRDLVTDVMIAEVEGDEALEDCHAAMVERLEEDEAYEGYEDAPVRETVERLCADLVLTPDWSLWTDDGWAIPPERRRPAHSVFHQPSRKPYFPDRGAAQKQNGNIFIDQWGSG